MRQLILEDADYSRTPKQLLQFHCGEYFSSTGFLLSLCFGLKKTEENYFFSWNSFAQLGA